MTNNQKAAVWGLAGIIVISIFGYTLYHTHKNGKEADEQSTILGSATTTMSAEEAVIRSTVTAFGQQLQKVSLTADTASVRAALDQHYAAYVESTLLSMWKNNIQSAPGRATSSPWPDRIEINAVQKNTDGTYTVAGEIVETTSTGESDRLPAALTVAKFGETWMITRFEQFSDKG